MLSSSGSISYGLPNFLAVPSMLMVPREEAEGRANIARQILNGIRAHQIVIVIVEWST